MAIPMALLNFLPRDLPVQKIRENDEARHKKLASFKCQVAKIAYESAFALIEAYLPVGDIFSGLDEKSAGKLYTAKFQKMAGLSVSAFRSKISSGDGQNPGGSGLVNPALLPLSPPKTASNGCPTTTYPPVVTKPDVQLTSCLDNLTAVMNNSTKIMQQMAAQTQQPPMPPLPLSNPVHQNLLRFEVVGPEIKSSNFSDGIPGFWTINLPLSSRPARTRSGSKGKNPINFN